MTYILWATILSSISGIILCVHNSYSPIVFKIKHVPGEGGGNKKFGVTFQLHIGDNLSFIFHNSICLVAKSQECAKLAIGH